MAIKQLSDGGPDGVRMGQSSTDLVAFHGATPTDQYALITAVSTTVPLSVTGNTVYAFQSSDQFINLIASVNQCIALLKEKGLGAS